MKFKNINNLLCYVLQEEGEEIEKILCNSNDYWRLLENTEKQQVSTTSILNCFYKLRKTKLENEFWSNVLCFIDNNSITNEVLNHFVENNIAILTLGHLSLNDEQLWKMTKYVDEAILTLGIRYYTKEKYTVEEFKELLNKFIGVEWLWRTLVSNKSNSSDKYKAFKKMLFLSTNFESIKQEMIDRSIEKKLKTTTGIKQINKYFRTGNPRYLKGIAQNPITPISILEELSKTHGIKYAKDIRVFALENIKMRK